MNTYCSSQLFRPLIILIFFHISIIAASNYLVQLPVQIIGYYTTWGTFSFPLVYLATDLTVRIFGQQSARKIVFFAMLPALLISYLFSVIFFEGAYQGTTQLLTLNIFVLRIAFASFTAYVVGQFADIIIFSRLRKNRVWWVAPSLSTVFGNLLDTVLFYFIAFYKSSDSFMASHFIEIGTIDYIFKIGVSILLFLPAYGVLLKWLTGTLTNDTAYMQSTANL